MRLDGFAGKPAHQSHAAINIGVPYLLEMAMPWQPVRDPSRFLTLMGLSLLALFFLAPHTVFSYLAIAAFALGAIGLLASLYVRILTGSRLFMSMFRMMLKIPSPTRRIFRQIDEMRIARNRNDPKIFSALDEAINALKAAPDQSVTPATAQLAYWPASFLAATVVLIIYAVLLAIHPESAVLVSHPQSITDHAPWIGLENPSVIAWIDRIAEILVALTIALIVGVGLSRAGFARWMANRFNKSLSRILKERAFGNDDWMGLVFERPACENMHLLVRDMPVNATWRPMHDDFDNAVEKITKTHLLETSKRLRQALGFSLLSGNVTITELFTAHFHGKELIHSAYFIHPDFAGFLAWILVTKMGVAPSAEFAKLDLATYEAWYADIVPLQEPASGGAG